MCKFELCLLGLLTNKFGILVDIVQNLKPKEMKKELKEKNKSLSLARRLDFFILINIKSAELFINNYNMLIYIQKIIL
jgi:hypothetical protein